MRKLLIGAGAVAFAVACSSSESDPPATVGGSATGGDPGIVGTGGAAPATGTGGAQAVVGTGGDPYMGTGGVMTGTGGAAPAGTGGVAPVGTGGVVSMGTGGVAPVGTGGVVSVGTGGVVSVGTGGVVSVGTGGVAPIGTGGTTTVVTGGTTSANTGGMTVIGSTGGSSQTDTGGSDTADDDTTPADDDDTTPETYPDEFVVNGNGFCTQGTLSGYAWTNSEDGFGEGFEEVGDAGELCATGVVETSDDYGNVGMIGWNIGQPSSGGTNSAVELSGTITITYKNAGGTPLRLQIEGSKAYCVDLSGTSASAKTQTFDLSDLVVECWEGGAQEPAYDGAGIESIQLIAPGDGGDAGEDRDVDMCLVSVEISMD